MPLFELALMAQQAAADPPGLATQLAPWGVLTAAVGLFAALLRSTVAAHKARADDWRTAAKAAQDRADERDRQLWAVLSAVKDRAGAA